MLLTDTDSLSYEVKSENVYEEFFKWNDLFDFSKYSKDSKFFDEDNKRVIGKMKLLALLFADFDSVKESQSFSCLMLGALTFAHFISALFFLHASFK